MSIKCQDVSRISAENQQSSAEPSCSGGGNNFSKGIS